MIVSVFLIISDKRLVWEELAKEKYRIDREWWVPLVFLFIALFLGAVKLEHVINSVHRDLEIIVLILSLAFVGRGLSRSGLFRYVAYKIVERAEGQTTRLLFYMFIFTALSTLFTTNDLVILIITPIIIEIAYQIDIKNLLPFLLPQFIVANTISMGLLIGSPTNIIIANQVNLNFLTYFVIMLLPTLVAFASIFAVFYIMVKTDIDDFCMLPSFDLREEYTVPQYNEEFNVNMRNWVLIFFFMIVLVTVVTFCGISLYWCSIPLIVVSAVYWNISQSHSKLDEPIKRLPYGILFFGMTFFIFAEAFASTTAFSNTVDIF